MNQPCYNSIALAQHQHDLDRQETKEHWIAAEVDRLLADDGWTKKAYGLWASSCRGFNGDPYDYAISKAKEQANREYQQHLSALEQARIDGQDGL